MMNPRCFPLALLLISLLLRPTFAHEKVPPQDPKQPPPQDPKQPPPQDPKQQPPQENQPPSPLHDRYKGHFSAVYAFGDSYTDTGNAQFLGGLTMSFSGSLSSPYGSTTFGKTSNRLCDGRLILDFVTDSLGLPALPPYQSTSANFSAGVNFAIAGTTSLAGDALAKLARTFMCKGTPMGVQTQIDWFKKFHLEHICKGLDPKACTAKLNTALFWVGEIGINDYSRAIGSTLSLRAIAEASVTHTFDLVATLIANGAKYIAVQGLPPVGCLPLDISLCPLNHLDKLGCSALVNSAVMIHNQILQHRLDGYRAQYPEITFIYADCWKAYLTIVNSPQKYQFQETHKTCCGAAGKIGNLNFNLQSLCGASGTSVCRDPSKYVNWDGIHLTEAMNFHVTDLLLNQGCCQPPFDQIINKNGM